MSGFDFAFALFSLVLGLALAENVSGFARVARLRARIRAGKAPPIRIGWLTPLLALLVMLNQVTLWHQGYAVRNGLPFSYLTLLGIVAVVGTYYLFSSLVWPDDPADWPDFDDYYDTHNRPILSGILILNIVTMLVAGRYSPGMTEAQAATVGETGNTIAALALLGTFALTLALIFVRARWLNVLLLAVLILLMLGGAVMIAASGLTPQ